MALEQIMELPVSQLALDNAHLHLWVPNSLLPEAILVIESWGFVYKTCFVWTKPQLGMGNYWRNSHELLLLGIRGRLPFLANTQRSWVVAPRTKHSTKPDSIRAIVEQVSPGPRLELFARRTTPGWTVFGDQVDRLLF